MGAVEELKGHRWMLATKGVGVELVWQLVVPEGLFAACGVKLAGVEADYLPFVVDASVELPPKGHDRCLPCFRYFIGRLTGREGLIVAGAEGQSSEFLERYGLKEADLPPTITRPAPLPPSTPHPAAWASGRPGPRCELVGPGGRCIVEGAHLAHVYAGPASIPPVYWTEEERDAFYAIAPGSAPWARPASRSEIADSLRALAEYEAQQARDAPSKLK